ncbi:TrkH family potassium uptake protein [Catenovulum sp. 2E275]|uniref:TrkH family potassium uptake protein n=1 Tax=Catenovulum sp. 2E275 TaxID=2980497 RepID=UPI0021D37C40|nr:TrkH family potassium uptake protein [Catenovulum sp. 2E275]MCU4675870.1 TrkH family potassium uptake protein [Catenovulum sp. 2E275]
MKYRAITRILGILVGIFSIFMLPPALVSLIYKDGGGLAFVLAFVATITGGLCLWYPNRNDRSELKAREGFLIVVLFWSVLGLVGALPFAFLDEPSISMANAIFESFSGLTTTGATVLTGLDSYPKAVLFYRQQLQWFGGMGIIVLAVAILPMLGIGGLQLYRAEIPGPVKDTKVTPRIADTAKHLWFIYLSLTIVCTLAYWGAGMTFFDAICHSFSTIAIGGFSTHDASMGYFDSALINWICIIFLIISSVNFTLHYGVLKSRSILNYLKDPEFKAFLSIQLVVTLITFWVLLDRQVYDSAETALNQAAFQAVSISTTAGFATDAFAQWPVFLPILLIFSSFIGGCAGSTGGGLKVVRVVLLYLQGVRELNRLVHPKAVYSIKLGRKALPDKVVDAVWGFFSAYALIFVVIMISLIATGLDDLTAFSATAACLNNLGPGLGEVAAHFGDIPDSAKHILVVAMLFGRLEIFTLLVLFTPTFWRS